MSKLLAELQEIAKKSKHSSEFYYYKEIIIECLKRTAADGRSDYAEFVVPPQYTEELFDYFTKEERLNGCYKPDPKQINIIRLSWHGFFDNEDIPHTTWTFYWDKTGAPTEKMFDMFMWVEEEKYRRGT